MGPCAENGDSAMNIFKYIFLAGVVLVALDAVVGISQLLLMHLNLIAPVGPPWALLGIGAILLIIGGVGTVIEDCL